MNIANSDAEKCVLKFSMCDDKYPLYKLNKDELKTFIKYAKKVENLEWKNLRIDKSLRYEKLSNFKRPDKISRDITVHSMRLSDKFRIIGYKEEMFFFCFWFDKNHNTC